MAVICGHGCYIIIIMFKVACRVSGRCVEMMGGVGFTKEYPVEKFYRDSKIGMLCAVCIYILSPSLSPSLSLSLRSNL